MTRQQLEYCYNTMIQSKLLLALHYTIYKRNSVAYPCSKLLDTNVPLASISPMITCEELPYSTPVLRRQTRELVQCYTCSSVIPTATGTTARLERLSSPSTVQVARSEPCYLLARRELNLTSLSCSNWRTSARCRNSCLSMYLDARHRWLVGCAKHEQFS